MNLVIKTLWNQAASKHGGDSWAEQTAFLEEFARLVVEECASELSRVPGGYDSTLYYNNITALREHFGIKK